MSELEETFRETKEAYREDKSEESRERFYEARDALQVERRSTRDEFMGIVADEVN